MKEIKMGAACSAQGCGGEMHTEFLSGKSVGKRSLG
jgi:hypothetical protein